MTKFHSPRSEDLSGPVLRIEDLRLTASHGTRELVKGVSLSVAPGRVLGLVGESGSGKSLTGLSCLGMLPQGIERTSGEVFVAGQPILDLAPSEQRRLRGSVVSMVLQDPLSGFHPMLTVGKQIFHSLQDHGVEKESARARVLEVLGQARLPEPEKVSNQFPHQLSGGMRQRAMIALALANRPSLLIADEPTTALDPTVQAGVLRLLRQLADDGLGVLFVTHNLGVVAGLCDEVSVMEHGLIVESGDVAQVLENPQHPYSIELLNASPRLSSPHILRAPLNAARTNEPAAISVEGASQRYGSRGIFGRGAVVNALSDVSFEIPRGSTTSIVGESGSGKSTLTRLLVGLEKPTAGRVTVAGQDMARLNPASEREFRLKVQLVFQDASRSLDPRNTAEELLLEALRVADQKASPSAVLQLCDRVHLPRTILRQRTTHLSGGQRQRVAIARALARNPEILVADEPVSALDVTNQQRIMGLFRELVEDNNLTLIMVSHDLALVRDMTDTVITMYKGRLMEATPAEEFYRKPRNPYSQALLDAMPDPSRIGELPTATVPALPGRVG
jgi:peptide/nickel transport system ATP-binding protein